MATHEAGSTDKWVEMGTCLDFKHCSEPARKIFVVFLPPSRSHTSLKGATKRIKMVLAALAVFSAFLLVCLFCVYFRTRSFVAPRWPFSTRRPSKRSVRPTPKPRRGRFTRSLAVHRGSQTLPTISALTLRSLARAHGSSLTPSARRSCKKAIHLKCARPLVGVFNFLFEVKVRGPVVKGRAKTTHSSKSNQRTNRVLADMSAVGYRTWKVVVLSNRPNFHFQSNYD